MNKIAEITIIAVFLVFVLPCLFRMPLTVQPPKTRKPKGRFHHD